MFLDHDANESFTTIELKCNFLGSAREGERVVGRAVPMHVGRSTQVWDVTVTNETTRGARSPCSATPRWSCARAEPVRASWRRTRSWAVTWRGAPGSLVGSLSVPFPEFAVAQHRSERRLRLRLSDQRREELRTTLWVVPAIELAGAAALFVVTYPLDRAAYRGSITFPAWVNNGSADAARQILTALAAAVITVVGLVFSILIVALTLASTQFGPRMLRNFIRDRGVQVTLGTFVATFFYAVLTLGSVSHGDRGDFVPHLSITVALGLTLVDLGVLVFFIDRVARSIQLPEVIAGIARDFSAGVATEFGNTTGDDTALRLSAAGGLPAQLESGGAEVTSTTSGYLQFVRYKTIVDIASDTDAVIELLYRPGHFVVRGLPLARVWPPAASPDVLRGLDRAHVTGAHRTLRQDPTFAIDQLVEIAIRALSPAVNDTFTALTCIDWLSEGLCGSPSRGARGASTSTTKARCA